MEIRYREKSMKKSRLNQAFEQHGFRGAMVDVEGLSIYYKYDDIRRSDGQILEGKYGAYLALIWDFDEIAGITLEQYEAIIDKIKWSFYNKGFADVEILNLLCTHQDRSLREFCSDYNENWILLMETGRLIIYENQKGEFLDVKNIVKEAETMKGVTFIPIITIFIIAINVIIFFLEEMTGFYLDTEHMLRWGAMFWPGVIEDHEWFRLVTHMFLHFGLSHLANNMIVLAFIGSTLEKHLGRIKYAILYLVSGILAGTASMVYNMLQDQAVISAGASGAIFGVVGAMTFIVLINKGKVENLSIRRLLLFIVLSLYSGLSSQGVDNMAHIGGFVSGFLAAFILYRRPGRRSAESVDRE